MKEQTNREMEQNGEAEIDSHMYSRLTSDKGTNAAKLFSSTNGPGINEHQNAKNI